MPAPDVAMTIEDVRNEDWPVQVKNDHLQLTEAEHTDEHHLREFWYISKMHRAAYGDEHVKPKHNLNLSLPNQFFKKGVFDAFTSERLHLLVKVIAERTKNTSTFEATVLGRLVRTQIFALTSLRSLKSGLRGKTRMQDGVRLSNKLECASLKVAAGDIVCCDQRSGVVRACASENDGQLFVIVAHLESQGSVTHHSHRFTPTTHLVVWGAETLYMPRAWYVVDGGDFVLIW